MDIHHTLAFLADEPSDSVALLSGGGVSSVLSFRLQLRATSFAWLEMLLARPKTILSTFPRGNARVERRAPQHGKMQLEEGERKGKS